MLKGLYKVEIHTAHDGSGRGGGTRKAQRKGAETRLT